MSKKTTKRSLALSVLSLVICVAMLLGTTFAWFTDSVTSGVNRIVAGNLDVEVTHTNAFVTAPKSIEGETKMFVDQNGNEILWEPGAMSFENLTVANVGNLALKYKMNMNVIDYNAVADTGDTLLDAIKVIVLTGADIITDVTREKVAALDWSSAETLGVFETSENTLLPKSDDPNREGISEESFQLIVYWQPTDADNRWNLNNGKHNTDGFKYGDEEALFIEFGVNLVAAQKEYESDSFDNQYDAGRLLPILPQSIHKSFETPTITTTFNPTTGEVGITSVGGTPFGVGEESVIVKNKSTNTGMGEVKKGTVQAVVGALINKVGKDNIDTEENQDSVIYINISTEKEPTATEAIYDISLSAEMTYTEKVEGQEPVSKTVTIDELTQEQLGGKTVVATINLGAGLKQVKVKHHKNPMTKLSSATPEDPNVEGYFYDEIVGTLTILSKSFSPFEVTYVQPKTPSECKHKFEYEQFDPYCHYTTCETCAYNEKEAHVFDESGVCELCGYAGNIGKVQIHTQDNADYVCITDAGMTNKSGEPVTSILGGAIVYNNKTKTLKLTQDVNVNQIDFTCDQSKNCGAVLDLNGHILTGGTWSAIDIYANAKSGDPYGYEGYKLVINDSNPNTVHPGAVYEVDKTMALGKYKGNYMWLADDIAVESNVVTDPRFMFKTELKSKVADYDIKGGIITNTHASKYAIPSDPYDGGGISTCGNTTVTFNKGTIAGIAADCDVAAIAMSRLQSGENCKLYMNEGSAIVGCSAGVGGVRMYGSGYFELNGGKISYCHGWEVGAAVFVEESSRFVMKSGTIDHCFGGKSESAVCECNGGRVEILGGTIDSCTGATVLFFVWDGGITLKDVTIKNCNSGAVTCYQKNYPAIVEGNAKFINNTFGWSVLLDQNGHPTYINGGDFTGVPDSYTDIFGNAAGVVVSGGTFTDARKAFVTEHLADGARISDNGDGTFNVIAK